MYGSMSSGHRSRCEIAGAASIGNTASASRRDAGLCTPAFSRVRCSCSHIRSLTGSNDETIFCCRVVLIVGLFVIAGMFVGFIPPSGASALKPSTSVGYFAVLVSPTSLLEVKIGELTSSSFGDSVCRSHSTIGVCHDFG